MVYALANGVPAAGVAFAAAMLLGVALTLCVVALLTIFARERRVRSWTRHGGTLAHLPRLLESATLLLIGLAPFVWLSDREGYAFVSAPTLKTLHFEDKDRQERHGGEEAVVFPPFRPMVVGTYPKGE
ncbi:hypothetical protein V1290_005555 [Bradyrhizobium sp. AZCC 1578]|uniref:hypothetical protein n=1 Tax=unclassified Bradyrhizobium TaxID=2631580 RepID=UPI002FF3C393